MGKIIKGKKASSRVHAGSIRDVLQAELLTLYEKIEEQAKRLGFDLDDEVSTARLIDIALMPIDENSPEPNGAKFWAERILAKTYMAVITAYTSENAVERIEVLCWANFMMGSLPDIRKDAESFICVECVIKNHSSRIAESGGAARAAKFKALELETIRLYKAGNWKTVPAAAIEITPKIVALSKNGGSQLFPTTTKPLEWIRAFEKSQKSSSS